MNVLLTFFNPVNGLFVDEKEVNLPRYFLPQTQDKTFHIEPDEPLIQIVPEFSMYDVVVEVV